MFELFAIGGRLRTLLEAAMVDAGLSPEEYAVYSTLVDFGPSSPTRMSALVGMPPTSMSRHVRAMQERHHVVRERSRADGRAVELRLTPSGLAAHRRAHDRFMAANLRFLGALPLDEQDVRDVLVTIRAAAERATERLALDTATAAS